MPPILMTVFDLLFLLSTFFWKLTFQILSVLNKTHSVYIISLNENINEI